MAGDWYDLPLMRSEPGPPLPEPPEGDQIVVLSRIPWHDYDALCRAREDCAGPRMSYLDGYLEIVSPGRPHEYEKTLLARLLEAFAEETGVRLNGLGSTTFRRKAKEAGVEPDECYFIGRGKRVPDLAIEVIHTSGGIDKLEIYRRLGVREVWFVISHEIYVYRLSGHAYRRWKTSVALKGLDLGEVRRVLKNADPDEQTETVARYRRFLRRRT